MGNQPSSTAGGAASGGAAAAGGAAASGSSNLNAMNREVRAILGAAGNSASVEFKTAFDAFKGTVVASTSSAYQSRLAQINDSSSIDILKEIRADIAMKLTTINTQFRALNQKMQNLPPAIFTKLNEKYSKLLSDTQANLTYILKGKSSKAGELIRAKEGEAAKFAASFPAVPTTKPGEMSVQERYAALKGNIPPGGGAGGGGGGGTMGGGRRRRSRKTHKKAKRTSRKAHKKAHKGKRRAVAA
jgi:hypothetical protein